jgi:hypothetical protein
MKKMIFLSCFIFISIGIIAQKNPASAGFDMEGSDKQAIEIADKVLDAMGGRKNWDMTRYISWNFFGARKHTWDKWTGNVRVDGLKDKSVALININTSEGRIFRNGAEISNPDSLKKYIKSAKSQWINDSYWLVMPFKLKDSGVTLKYLGEGKTSKDEEAYLLGLNFNAVGDTPQNKYQIWVTKSDNLVKQWAYYAKIENEKPGFTLPWQNYQKMGKILLSGDRGERKLTDITISKKIDKKVFTDF